MRWLSLELILIIYSITDALINFVTFFVESYWSILGKKILLIVLAFSIPSTRVRFVCREGQVQFHFGFCAFENALTFFFFSLFPAFAHSQRNHRGQSLTAHLFVS